MTQPPPPPAGVKTRTLTFENGGPLDGAEWEVAAAVGVVRAMAYKRDDGTWGDPKELVEAAGLPADTPVDRLPAEIMRRVMPVEYLVDKDRGIASFREPAEIRDEREENEIPPEFRPADPRAADAKHLAWQAMTSAFDVIEPFEECEHLPLCRSVSMHWAQTAVNAITADGLRVVEPSHVTEEAADAFARLIFDAADREMGDPADPSDWDSPLGSIVRDQWRAVAADVLSMLDVRDKVVIVHPSAEIVAAGADFAGLADVLREVAGADLMLVMPADGSVTLEAIDREAMRAHGWVRAEPDPESPPPEPVEAVAGPEDDGAGNRAYPATPPDGETIAQRDARERREAAAARKPQESWETVWECEEPPDDAPYQVIRDTWNDDGSVRTIQEINRLDQNAPVAVLHDGTTTRPSEGTPDAT